MSLNLMRNRADLLCKFEKYGIVASAHGGDNPEFSAFSNYGLHEFIWNRKNISTLWTPKWAEELPLPLAHFHTRMGWVRHLRALSSSGLIFHRKTAESLVAELLVRLLSDHVREVYLPDQYEQLARRASRIRASLAQLCSHPDAPAEASGVLAHARMVEARINERLWEIADLPTAGQENADVTALTQVLGELERQMTTAMTICASAGATMLSGVEQDQSLLAYLRSESFETHTHALTVMDQVNG